MMPMATPVSVRQFESLADDHPENITLLRAECHADTDLMCPRREGVLDEPKDPDGGHQERNYGEPDQERGLEATLPK